MALIKVAWCVLRVKNMHLWSPSDPSGTAAAEAKPRCVYSILKPHGQSSRCQVRLLLPKQSRGAYTQFENHMVRVSSPPQSRSKAVVCVSTPRMYPRSGYFLVKYILNPSCMLFHSAKVPLKAFFSILFKFCWVCCDKRP